jgi:twitching motility protein PilT
MTDSKTDIEDLIAIVLKEDASDLHLSEGRQPMIRVAGFLVPLLKYPALSKTDIKNVLSEVLEAKKLDEFLDKKEADFAYQYKDLARFRGNAFFQLGQIGIALRLIPNKIKTLEELNLPSVLESFVNKQQGFFLVVGPTGQGKSTTLAAMIDMINERRLEHIITIEDPIEYIFEPKKSLIDQREVHQDTENFESALNSMFRQDVDVMMIGEMRNAETMAIAVTAAETGHLVFSTLHTNTAAQTIARVIDSFVAEQQNQIRIQLSTSLLGIFSQRLIPRISGGLIPACELLINNNAVGNLIRENRVHEIDTVIETGSSQGMIDLNRYLAELVRTGEISAENAYLNSHNPKNLEQML